MDEILHANIFFVITSVATVVVVLLVALILWQVFKLAKSLRRLSERLEMASEQVAEDVSNVRSFVVQGGVFSKMIGLLMGAVARGSHRNDE